jgi:cytochrome c-type biogenesis protein CcmH/NrfG
MTDGKMEQPPSPTRRFFSTAIHCREVIMHCQKLITSLARIILLLLSLLGSAINAAAQQPSAAEETKRGIQLYQQGNTKEAVRALRDATKKNKTDAEAWHFLGLALYDSGNARDARKAFEQAISLHTDFIPSRTGLAYLLLLTNQLNEARKEAEEALRFDPQNVEANYIIATVQLRENAFDEVIQRAREMSRHHPELAAPWLLRSQAIMGLFIEARLNKKKTDAASIRSLTEAADCLERFLQLSQWKDDPSLKLWREQLKGLKMYAELIDKKNSVHPVLSFSELTRKPKLIFYEKAPYTDLARNHEIEGVVKLMMIVDETGTVKSPVVLQSLPDGLTESALGVASKMRWKPGEEDGKPVSVILWTVEFFFKIY